MNFAAFLWNFPMKSPLPSEIDKIDHSIIDQLRVDGRMTVTELAARVGLSKTPCAIRLKRLMDEGYIRGFRAIIDPGRLGVGHIAFAEVKLSDTRERALEDFRCAVLQVEEIEECHMMASNFDYLLKIRTRDIQNYRRVLGEKISSLPHVSSTSTYVVMETVIEN